MKQEIVCPSCAAELRCTFPTDTPFPGEGVKFVPGTALRPFICDQCGGLIDQDGKCTAFSVFTDYSPAPYYPWEGGYVRPLNA